MRKGFDKEFNSLVEARVYDDLKTESFKFKTECCHGRPTPYNRRYYCEYCLRDITGEFELFIWFFRSSLVKLYTKMHGQERVVKVYQKKPFKNKNHNKGVKGTSSTTE